jgi:TonB-linked SusC/RagA family outer membrane protein
MIARFTYGSALAALLLLLLAAAPAAAQNATVTGLVRDASSGEPLAGTQVYLEGTSHNAVAGEDGRYTIANVPPGTYTVVARLIGYSDGRQANVVLSRGAAESVNFNMRTSALRIQEVVVTGVTDPTAGTKVPFTVSKVSREDMPIPSNNAVQALAGRVAGARVVQGSGQPGSGTSIRLRARRSVNTSSSPLMVVDGIVQSANMIDIDPNDIESIEVVKGAAAASLYGSRAQAGVVQITTRRGTSAGLDRTRISVRSEYGWTQVPDVPSVPTYHAFRQNSQGQWIDSNGNVVDRIDRELDDDKMLDNPFLVETFNPFAEFFDQGVAMKNSVTISRNMESTNFYISAGDDRQGGIVPEFSDGYNRQNFRLNLDHRLRDDLTVGWTSYYSRSATDGLSGNPFWNLRFIPADVDIRLKDEDGDYFIRIDPTMLEVNPLYAMSTIESESYRARTQGSLNARYSPTSWLNFDGLVAVDRSDRESWSYFPKGYKTLNPSNLNNGQYSRSYNYDQGISGHVQSSLIHSIGELTLRPRVRYNFELEEGENQTATARNFLVGGLYSLNNGQEEFAGGSSDEVKSESMLGSLGLDYAGKYIIDALVRRDGSSLFGPDARWNNYFRVAGSYIMNEEAWWPVEQLTLFKPYFAIGTAGSRPGFSWRYETWSVGTTGPSKGQLGNRNLKPEKTTEMEMGLAMALNDRYSLEIVHSRSETEDQLIPIPLPGVFGYSSQYQNAGYVKSRSWEATVDALIMNRPDFTWRSGLTWDRGNSTLHEWPRSCYVTAMFYRCEGEDFGTMYGRRFMTSVNNLPERHAGSHNQFQVNDDGYLVPVGNATWRDGLAQNLWGTRVEIDGVNYNWGMPIIELDETGNPALLEIGDANPDFNLGWQNNFQYRGIQIFTLWHGKFGGDVYSVTRQWPYRDNFSWDQVQAGKSDETKKPIDYYQTLYNTNSTNSHFVEDGSFIKLREMSVGYRFSRDQIGRFLPIGIDALRLELIGRNLLTFTDYSGIDPEVGNSGAGGVTENPTDSFDYPNFRTFTLGINIDF